MKDRKPMQLRLPRELKDWIKAEAEKNGSSQNSEIIRAVRDRMARVDDQQPA
jgi:predicted HicB family RNase H-like nuclease